MTYLQWQILCRFMRLMIILVIQNVDVSREDWDKAINLSKELGEQID